MNNQSLGARLRCERERRQIALSSIAANTKIGITIFEGLERDDVSRWPSGIFRRSFIRAYADALGLDATAITQEFLERFPDPADDPLAIDPNADRPSTGHRLRLTFADDELPFLAKRRLLSWRHRCTVIAWDIGGTAAVGFPLFLTFGNGWMSFALAAACYYLAAILVLGNTPGVCLSDRKKARSRDTSSTSWNDTSMRAEAEAHD